MLDRIQDYGPCLAQPDRWAVATVTEVTGRAPCAVGCSMAVRDDLLTIGSISSGCVEGSIVHAALESIGTARSVVVQFGYGEESPFAPGLACGGDISVLIEPFPAVADAGAAAMERLVAGRGFGALVRELPDPDGRPRVAPVAFDPATEVPAPVRELFGERMPALESRLAAGGTGTLDVDDGVGSAAPARRLLVETHRPRPRLIVYGANDYSAALASSARLLDRHVIVCDARPVFATAQRHPGADEVVVGRPDAHLAAEIAAGRVDRRTAVVVVAHDDRWELPVLDLALRAGCAYVGALGSRRTSERRLSELRFGGLAHELIARLHAPIGLDIGASTPQEVAVSILAEIIAAGHDDDAQPDSTAARRIREQTRLTEESRAWT